MQLLEDDGLEVDDPCLTSAASDATISLEGSNADGFEGWSAPMLTSEGVGVTDEGETASAR